MLSIPDDFYQIMKKVGFHWILMQRWTQIPTNTRNNNQLRQRLIKVLWSKIYNINVVRQLNVSSVVEFLKMVGPKKQDFCPRNNMLKGNFFKTILLWIMVCQKVPKSYFQSQFSMSKIDGIFSKKNHLRISI